MIMLFCPCVVIPTLFTRFGCKYPQIKAERLHLKPILSVLFQVHCGGVQSQNDENSPSIYRPNYKLTVVWGCLPRKMIELWKRALVPF